MSFENWCDYSVPEYKTCPECGGTGKDNATLDWKCYCCNGLGRIKTTHVHDEKNNNKK